MLATDIPIEESKYLLQLLDLFDGKISLDELEEMDIPRLTSLIEARIQLINERNEIAANAAKQGMSKK